MKTADFEIQKEATISKVSFQGLDAFIDTYAAQENTFKFLSLFGSRVSVRAIWSALFSGAPVLVDGQEFCVEVKDSWQVFQRLMPSGILHAVCFPKLIDLARVQNEFVVLGYTREDIENRFFLYLDRVSESPIKQEWGNWIFKKALVDEKAAWFKSLNMFAARYQHDERWLENLVGELVRKRKITV